jgi:DNA processing protein
MTGADAERLARAALSRIAEPTMPGLSRAVDQWGAAAVWAAVRGEAAAPAVDATLLDKLRTPGADVSPERDLEVAAAAGARLVCPQDEEWPTGLAVLGGEEPLALWVRGERLVSEALDRSVAVVGARAATTYGGHVASEIGYGLAGRGWTVVSGGAFGIDALAHRGALAAGGITVAVLACGVDVPYPRSHDRLFARIAEEGLIISEWPPGTSPRPHRFLVRNRVIAAGTAGTVVVEGAVRSGALSTGRCAQKLGRPLMVVPGPVTSVMSAGCHLLLREEGTRLVTNVAEVVEEVGRLGDDLSPRPEGETRNRDHLSAVLRGVLEAVPSLRPAGPAVLASRAGVDLVVLRRSINQLIDAGFVERMSDGFRLSSAERHAVRARREAMIGGQTALLVGEGLPQRTADEQSWPGAVRSGEEADPLQDPLPDPLPDRLPPPAAHQDLFVAGPGFSDPALDPERMVEDRPPG